VACGEVLCNHSLDVPRNITVCWIVRLVIKLLGRVEAVPQELFLTNNRVGDPALVEVIRVVVLTIIVDNMMKCVVEPVFNGPVEMLAAHAVVLMGNSSVLAWVGSIFQKR
jgi:hypothetical protein